MNYFLSSINRSSWCPWPTPARSEPTRRASAGGQLPEAGSSFPFLPRRSALIPSRALMHGSPWLRASTAIKRQNVEGGWRLGDGGVLIGCVSGDDDIVFYFFNFGFLSGQLVLNRLLRLQHNLVHYPTKVLNRAAGILTMRGYI